MIRGILSLQRVQGTTSLAISVFSECCRAENQKSSDLKPKIQEHIKHFYSEESSIGFLLGDNMKRSVFCSYSSESFVLENLAARFLFGEDGHLFEDFVLTTKFPKTSPFLMIFIEGDKVLVATCYGKDDFQINVLNPGTVNITNFMIHSMRKNDDEAQYLLSVWRDDFNLYQSTASCLVKGLQSKIASWPPPTGLGITLLKVNNRSIVTISDPGCCKKTDSRPKPKGPVSSFNYFCMAARKQSNSFHLLGSDMSKVLGSQWNSLTDEQKEPYVELARRDYLRYTYEMDELTKQMDEPQPKKQKPNTAYNLFIVQEKQFLFGLNIPDAQTRLGKHGSDRWASMSVAEKELYLVQREVEVTKASMVC